MEITEEKSWSEFSEKDFEHFFVFFNLVYREALEAENLADIRKLQRLVDDTYPFFGENSVYLKDVLCFFAYHLMQSNMAFERKNAPQYVYIVENDGRVKIGRTKDLKTRLQSLRCAAPFAKVIAVKECENAVEEENRLHNLFKEKQVALEWFKLSDEDLEKLYAQGFIREVEV